MLDDPGLSRQWVLRRLQRALTLDLAAGAYRRGLRRFARQTDGAFLRRFETAAADRCETARTMIRELGSTPYSSVGLARLAARLGGTVSAAVGAFAWRPLLRRLVDETVAEYDALAAFLDDAVGVPTGLAERIRVHEDEIRAEAEWLRR